ncbi:hypothetical protein NIES2135_27300 [Leptolyngbya boryana NIES-2135]|uniref:Uncharacterized protein n=1 Tax=Leptolyngbya boryana NIES-2135 TaxID=1973484 RepID=A0A1Z4JGK9_LEPBY|nr:MULTISPECIES: hypothetical protein [Leptolyngbya]BAY55905.1 hypothetical protein NIES2135_27300 [Leptolyngbya boryana NIES-2135]MBD2368794.1 hypothetical protein [Leptolyngbya sp. FACHB-161]MBD2375338.1 hypothetical protein [Leptolyngbya sp. FACHB-238]MBD2399756.1 hypothetical protein [Leptolyngbya sp. FACHB-239]MBD2405962.1 hypothetical protein [Leptolyngbya sp. FACHB-402]
MAEIELQQNLRAGIAQKMIDSNEVAKLRLRTLKSVLPVEIKSWLEGVAIYADFWGDKSANPPVLYPVIAFNHGSRRSAFLEPENLVWLEALTYRTYQYTGIAHILIQDGKQVQVSSYCPSTHKYTLWSV